MSEQPTSAESARLIRKSRWALLASLLCGLLAAIDFHRYQSQGMIVVGRESQVLTGVGARAIIASVSIGAVSFFAYAIYLRWKIGHLTDDPRPSKRDR